MNVSAKDARLSTPNDVIELGPELAERLILFCEHTGQDKAALIGKAIEQLLDEEEDLILVERAIEEIKSDPQRYSLDEIKAIHGLED